MKKHYVILTAITVLALAAMSCGIQFVGSTPTPTPAPQGPVQQNFDPGPQNGNSGVPQVPQGPQGPGNGVPGPQGPDNGNQGPNPNGGVPGGNPGQGEIVLFTVDQMTLKKGECTNLHWETRGGFQAKLNNQPVPPAGQQQVCPTQTTVYNLGLDTGNQMLTNQVTITVKSGGQNSQPITPTKPSKNKSDGGNKTVTDTPSSPFGGTNIQIRTVDVGISNIYPAANGHIMVTIQNYGNDFIDTTITVSCRGTVTTKDTPPVIGQLGPYTQSVGFKLNAGERFDHDTKIARDPKMAKLDVICSITPPAHDNNSSNDKKGPVTVKNELN